MVFQDDELLSSALMLHRIIFFDSVHDSRSRTHVYIHIYKEVVLQLSNVNLFWFSSVYDLKNVCSQQLWFEVFEHNNKLFLQHIFQTSNFGVSTKL